jgi:hypothetical protein
MMRIPRCPRCRQEFRLGVRLPPIKAEIWRLLVRAGSAGVESAALSARVYADDRRPWTRDHGRDYAALKAHICSLNNMIARFGFRVVCSRFDHHYRLERRPCI